MKTTDKDRCYIRRFTADDAEGVLKRINALRRELGEREPLLTAKDLETEALGKRRRILIGVAVLNEALCGYVLCQGFFDPLSVTQGLQLCDIYVDKRLRREGVGTLLIEWVRSHATARQKHFLIWFSNPENRSAHEFYAKLGAKHAATVSYMLPLIRPRKERYDLARPSE